MIFKPKLNKFKQGSSRAFLLLAPACHAKRANLYTQLLNNARKLSRRDKISVEFGLAQAFRAVRYGIFKAGRGLIFRT